jgi:hypothetical protein
LTEQSKILKNKKKLENIMICKVLKVWKRLRAI